MAIPRPQDKDRRCLVTTPELLAGLWLAGLTLALRAWRWVDNRQMGMRW